MSAAALRAALAIFVLGVLAVWLVRPIGDVCPDVGKLPAGSTSSSSPSFAPPLTRACTYTTPEGTVARKRYVPVVDWLVLAVVAGVVGAGVALLGPAPGPGTSQPARAQPAPRTPRPRSEPLSAPRALRGAGDLKEAGPGGAEPDDERHAGEPDVAERDSAVRERARQERERARERAARRERR